jgi:hypothetical protein
MGHSKKPSHIQGGEIPGFDPKSNKFEEIWDKFKMQKNNYVVPEIHNPRAA